MHCQRIISNAAIEKLYGAPKPNSIIRCLHCSLRRPTDFDKYSNIVERLNRDLVEPILKESDLIFTPDAAKMSKAEEFFRANAIKYVGKGVHASQWPKSCLPELCFLGASNSGKSTLLRTLFADKTDLVKRIRVSKKPGHTRKLYFYQIGNEAVLVDMPGYGVNMPKHFHFSAQDFIQSNRNLDRTFLLIDGGKGLEGEDVEALHMLQHLAKSFVVVVTKADSAPSMGILARNVFQIKSATKDLISCFPQLFVVSAHMGWGIAHLQSFLQHVAGCDK